MTESNELPVAFAFEVSLSTPELSSETSVVGIFQEVSGILAETVVGELDEGGENKFVHRLPKQTKHPNLVLKRGVVKLASPLLTWVSETFDSSLSSPIVPRLLIVKLLDQTGKPLVSWRFHGAWPVKWSVNDFNSTKEIIEIEAIEFSYNLVERTLSTV